jgi:hypothetical protein
MHLEIIIDTKFALTSRDGGQSMKTNFVALGFAVIVKLLLFCVLYFFFVFFLVFLTCLGFLFLFNFFILIVSQELKTIIVIK